MKYVTILFILLIIVGSPVLFAQENLNCQHPEIGQPIPDLKFSNVKFHSSNYLSFSDFRGKWLFVDFWFPGCSNCIKTLKPFNDLQVQFQKEIQFVLIGINEKKYGGTEALYSKLQQKQRLQHISIYDSLVSAKWCIISMPHVLVVDPQGILRFVTTGQDLTAEKIKDLLEEKPVSLYPKQINSVSFEESSSSEPEKEMVIYRSQISKWNGETPDGPDVNRFVQLPPTYRQDGFRIRATTLQGLYKQAYVGQSDWGLGNYIISKSRDSTYWRAKYIDLYGRLYPEIAIEVSDQRPFNFDTNRPYTGGLFNYDMETCNVNLDREQLMQTMQQDLRNCFGYEVVIETRPMPYFKLVANSDRIKKLRSTENNFWISPGSTAAGFQAKNISMERFLSAVTNYISDRIPLIVNETGVDFCIDVELDADMTDFSKVKNSLNALGMDIVKGTKLMEVIVIKDAINERKR